MAGFVLGAPRRIWNRDPCCLFSIRKNQSSKLLKPSKTQQNPRKKIPLEDIRKNQPKHKVLLDTLLLFGFRIPVLSVLRFWPDRLRDPTWIMWRMPGSLRSVGYGKHKTAQFGERKDVSSCVSKKGGLKGFTFSPIMQTPVWEGYLLGVGAFEFGSGGARLLPRQICGKKAMGRTSSRGSEIRGTFQRGESSHVSVIIFEKTTHLSTFAADALPFRKSSV